jgi:hypothetical protein
LRWWDQPPYIKVCKRASKKQLQSLAGKLNWAPAVIRGGRVFLHRIIDCITSLERDWHKILLKGEVLADIAWWRKFFEARLQTLISSNSSRNRDSLSAGSLSSIVEESISIPKKVIEVVGSTTFDQFIISIPP